MLRRNIAKAPFTSLAILALFAVPTVAQAQQKPPGGSFLEEFNQLSPSRWYISDGWNNGAHQNCTWLKRNVKLSDGVLKLVFAKQKTKDREYGCAEVQTKTRYSYGTYEVRLKSAAGKGLNSAMFTYVGPVSKQPWDEIDFEVLGKDPSQVQLNQYVDGKGGTEKFAPVEGGADQAFNDYAFIWEKERLRYFVNGVLVHTVTDTAAIPTHPSAIMLSMWGSDTLESWLGKFVDPGEVALEVDRISYTAPGDKCQFPTSVACSQQ
jgi:endo-1,3-1,4-beta-glycanase ExoK